MVEKKNLDDDEEEKRLVLQFVNPTLTIDTNKQNRIMDSFGQELLERELRVLELPIKEGYF